ncbi:MAG: hypothetical protein V9G10_01465 [Candidatus Nanopelagicales bacterium]
MTIAITVSDLITRIGDQLDVSSSERLMGDYVSQTGDSRGLDSLLKAP